MKKKLVKIMLFIIVMFSCESTTPDLTSIAPGQRLSFDIYSNYTNHNYKINIFYPDGFDQSIEYHVYYLLDADYDYRWVANHIKEYHPDNAILVGIEYKKRSETEYNRVIDFTFPEDTTFVESSQSGKADKYIQFLNMELIPEIENYFKIISAKNTLLGTSASGYFGLYITLQNTYENPFNNIIAVSPSLWWSNRYLFSLEEAFNRDGLELNGNIYIAMGELEDPIMLSAFDDFTDIIKNRDYNTGNIKFEYLSGLNHDNSSSLGYPFGLQYIQ